MEQLESQWATFQATQQAAQLVAQAALEAAKTDSTLWGLMVDQLISFFDDIRDELDAYSKTHALGPDFEHVCMEGPPLSQGMKVLVQGLSGNEALNGSWGICEEQTETGSWIVCLQATGQKLSLQPDNLNSCTGSYSCAHGKATFRKRRPTEDWSTVRKLGANMHCLVPMFVKSVSTDDMGYALTINRRQPLKLQLFVSHCWNADFADFVKTVRNSVPNNKVIWVCSLCICQNASIEDAIGQTIDSSPFAVALKAARQMLLVVDTLRDGVVETLTRAWCVCEGSLAVKFDTPLMIRGPDMYMSMQALLPGDDEDS